MKTGSRYACSIIRESNGNSVPIFPNIEFLDSANWLIPVPIPGRKSNTTPSLFFHFM